MEKEIAENLKQKLVELVDGYTLEYIYETDGTLEDLIADFHAHMISECGLNKPMKPDSIEHMIHRMKGKLDDLLDDNKHREGIIYTLYNQLEEICNHYGWEQPKDVEDTFNMLIEEIRKDEMFDEEILEEYSDESLHSGIYISWFPIHLTWEEKKKLLIDDIKEYIENIE